MLLHPHTKHLRAELIAAHVARAGLDGVVCFSCGNASRALYAAGVDVLAPAPGDRWAATQGSHHKPLVVLDWYTTADVRRLWPRRLDATSGHLPQDLMRQLAASVRASVGPLKPGTYRVPSGSGETVVALCMAYAEQRDVDFVAVYDHRKPETTYNAQAPLNDLVRALARVEHL